MNKERKKEKKENNCVRLWRSIGYVVIFGDTQLEMVNSEFREVEMEMEMVMARAKAMENSKRRYKFYKRISKNIFFSQSLNSLSLPYIF